MRAAGAAALLGALACTPDFRVVGDPTQPLGLDLSTGVPTARVHVGTGVATAVLDTGSPLSTLLSADGCRADTTLVLGDPPRLVFPDLHPYCVDAASIIGGDLLVHYEAIFAGDRCGGGALSCLQLVPQEVQSTLALSQENPAFAVISFRLLGGGTFVDTSGRKHIWPATRVPLRVCINPPLTYPSSDPPGYDATLLVATGRQPLHFTESAIARLGLGMTVDRIALVGHTLGGSVQDPGACGELRRSRCLYHGDGLNSCDTMVLTDPDSIGNDVDRAAYVILDGPIPITPIADDDPYVLGARNEVRPRISDIDGLLGASVLDRLEQIRIDYQGVSSDDVDSGTRFITRCKAGDDFCHLRPRCPKGGTRTCPPP